MNRTQNGLSSGPGGAGAPTGSEDRLADRRAALRRAVTDLGDVTSRFRERLADSGHEVSSAPSGVTRPAPVYSPQPRIAELPPSPAPASVASPPVSPPATGGAPAGREEALAEARQRFASASRQADALVRSIAEAVESETHAFQANVEASVEARWREVETEAQRHLRRARTEADALVDQRRRRIAEVSDRILELGETLAGRLSDADEVRGQFDSFVQSLSEASNRLASLPAVRGAASSAPVSEIAGRAAERPAPGLAEAA
ncbi:MAG: hypothetical protein ACR2OC_02205 [Solirubrobacterales bacterium]